MRNRGGGRLIHDLAKGAVGFSLVATIHLATHGFHGTGHARGTKTVFLAGVARRQGHQDPENQHDSAKHFERLKHG